MIVARFWLISQPPLIVQLECRSIEKSANHCKEGKLRRASWRAVQEMSDDRKVHALYDVVAFDLALKMRKTGIRIALSYRSEFILANSAGGIGSRISSTRSPAPVIA